jgi:hypothetical protein
MGDSASVSAHCDHGSILAMESAQNAESLDVIAIPARFERATVGSEDLRKTALPAPHIWTIRDRTGLDDTNERNRTPSMWTNRDRIGLDDRRESGNEGAHVGRGAEVVSLRNTLNRRSPRGARPSRCRLLQRSYTEEWAGPGRRRTRRCRQRKDAEACRRHIG